MALELTGKLIAVLPEQTGNGKNGTWVKQEFVVETQEKFPKKVCCSAWGDKVDELRNVRQGDTIKVSFNLESREFNSRWYTDVRAWKIEGGNGGGGDVPPPPMDDFLASGDDGGDLPF